MQAVTTIGLDIAKSVFQVHGIDVEGKVLIRRPAAHFADAREGVSTFPFFEQHNTAGNLYVVAPQGVKLSPVCTEN